MIEFLQVTVVTIGSALILVGLFAGGVRLRGEAQERTGSTRTALMTASVACTTLCALAVLFGLYLLIPYFHH
ncbi:hypothetical protein [Devriesea agamarum]|uniref:hypothetical protein n=1 Tax=Devriesea agamarum TaxID=472569 RepID=UPI00071DF6D6|nr:hypothetical protein [Devriesea agamarum]